MGFATRSCLPAHLEWPAGAAAAAGLQAIDEAHNAHEAQQAEDIDDADAVPLCRWASQHQVHLLWSGVGNQPPQCPNPPARAAQQETGHSQPQATTSMPQCNEVGMLLRRAAMQQRMRAAEVHSNMPPTPMSAAMMMICTMLGTVAMKSSQKSVDK